MENNRVEKQKPAERNRGIDPRQVFAQMLREDFDPNKIEALHLVFGTRKRGGHEQIVSVIDLRDGRKADTYPVASRFQPTPGRTIQCYVFFRKKKTELRGREEERITGFAIPINIREAERHGEWLGIGNNLLKLVFREGDEGSYYAFGPNGKRVILPKEAGFEPSTEKEAIYMVSELMNCYIAHCLVPPEEMAQEEGDVNDRALVLQAETVGAVLESIDTYGIRLAGRIYDACELMDLPATATMEEIRARYRALQKVQHPDKRVAEFRALTGSEPAAQYLQSWNHEFRLIDEAHNRMVLIRERAEATRQYLEKGRESHRQMPIQITVGDLGDRLNKTLPDMKKVLGEIGYPGVVKKTVLGQKIAWVAAGCVLSEPVDDLPVTGQK